MKNLFIMAVAIFSILTVSCNKDSKDILPVDETEGLKLVQKIVNDTSEIELYTISGKIAVGYNEVFLRIKDKITNTYITDAEISWMPVMHMMSTMHSCPKSMVEKVAGKQTMYKGFLVFQMPENASERWTLSLNFQAGGLSSVSEDTIAVMNTTRKRVSVFTGADSKKYIVALIEPSVPEVAVNNLVLGLFKMQDMMTFPQVTNCKIEIDPRMPSMGNHSSPNNVNPVLDSTDNLYRGKLSLTMTGYWKLNLMVKSDSDEILKGEAVTASNESSSLYLEVEF